MCVDFYACVCVCTLKIGNFCSSIFVRHQLRYMCVCVGVGVGVLCVSVCVNTTLSMVGIELFDPHWVHAVNWWNCT